MDQTTGSSVTGKITATSAIDDMAKYITANQLRRTMGLVHGCDLHFGVMTDQPKTLQVPLSTLL